MEQLKKLRILAGKTQTEVAKSINVTQFTYSNYETGKSEPNIEILSKLANYFHTTIDNLVGHKVPYLLDKSLLTKKQNMLVEQITALNDQQCEVVSAYITGMQLRVEEKENIIKKLKGE